MLGVEQKCRPQRLTDDEKHPKAVHEKWKFGPKYKWSKNLIFGILFLKVLFRAYKAFIFVQTFQWISSEFFLISDFLPESRKANKKKNLQKRSHVLQYSFAQKAHSFYEHQLTWHCKQYAPATQPKPFWFSKFSENIFTAPFLDAQELHSWSTLKANACIFLYISLRKFLFQRRSKVLSGKGWDGGRLNNFLKVVHCLGLVNILQFFVLIDIFENSTIFSILIFLFIALKRLNFPDNLDFKGKI